MILTRYGSRFEAALAVKVSLLGQGISLVSAVALVAGVVQCHVEDSSKILFVSAVTVEFPCLRSGICNVGANA